MSVHTQSLFNEPGANASRRARVLVVDDRPTTRAVVKGVLGSSQYLVSEAESGARALACLETSRYDVMVLDILMPDMDGLEVLRRAREKFSASELPIIIATVRHRSGDMVEALRQGANDYVTKPIDYPVLLARIESQLSRKRAEDELRQSRLVLVSQVQARTAELLRVSDALKRETSERRQAEEARRVREERFRDFAQVSADWFWELDAELAFTYVSDRFVEITGLSAAQVDGRDVHDVFAGQIEDTRNGRDHFKDLEMRRRFEELEFLWRRPDGSGRVLRLSGKPLFSRNGIFEGYRGAGRDVTEARNLTAQLSYGASHDALTGLVNRAEFEQRLRSALESTRMRLSASGSRPRFTEHVLCHLNLDQVKVINETCGHVAGDELLRQVGALLSDQIRRRDAVARLGGDEFGILMEHCSLEQARRIADNVRRAIEDYQFVWEDKHFNLGVSIGATPLNELTESITAALSAADSACCAAKQQGRNRIHVYHEDEAEPVHGEMQWVQRINRALQNDRFRLYCQPIAPIDGREDGAHYEFLIRMLDETGKIITPGAFLPAAERYNLMTKIDRWVILESFAWLNRHPEHLPGLYQCSINLSGHSLSDERFLDFVTQELSQQSIPPHKVCFEITETAAIENLISAKRFITALKGLGCMFSLDDFGSGLSSFAYLKNLPVDILKIDGMFVRGIVANPIELAMVRSINEIGHVMGKRTVAEFVEDRAIFEKLKETGVDYAQGYLVGPPKPILD